MFNSSPCFRIVGSSFQLLLDNSIAVACQRLNTLRISSLCRLDYSNGNRSLRNSFFPWYLVSSIQLHHTYLSDNFDAPLLPNTSKILRKRFLCRSAAPPIVFPILLYFMYIPPSSNDPRHARLLSFPPGPDRAATVSVDDPRVYVAILYTRRTARRFPWIETEFR